MTTRPRISPTTWAGSSRNGGPSGRRELLAELRERWRRDHLVAGGPTEVLDALQQGRAGEIIFGTRRDMRGPVRRVRLPLR